VRNAFFYPRLSSSQKRHISVSRVIWKTCQGDLSGLGTQTEVFDLVCLPTDTTTTGYVEGASLASFTPYIHPPSPSCFYNAFCCNPFKDEFSLLLNYHFRHSSTSPYESILEPTLVFFSLTSLTRRINCFGTHFLYL
jgi:hypothetical protein